MDAFAVSVSHGLQYGVPIKKFVRAFTNTSFAPSGITDDKEIRTASSLIDYIFRRIGKTYMSFDDQLEVGLASIDDMPQGQTSLLGAGDASSAETSAEQAMETLAEAEAAITEAMTTIAASTADLAASQPDSIAEPLKPSQTASEAGKTPVQDAAAPLCYNCGNQTMRAGTCYVCTACGSTTGCS
jgi:ribonucleoside-diphosphate reductase alpha chain